MLLHLMATVVLLAVALACARFLYEVSYPSNGTRPRFLHLMLAGPVGLVGAVSGVFGLLALISLPGRLLG